MLPRLAHLGLQHNSFGPELAVALPACLHSLNVSYNRRAALSWHRSSSELLCGMEIGL